MLQEGHEVAPDWASGAILLVPLSQEQARKACLELRSHHVVIFPGDKGRLLNALAALPCRQRPRIRGDEEMLGLKLLNSMGMRLDRYDFPTDVSEGSSDEGDRHERLILRVDRTFLTCVAPASEFSVNESAPCGDSECRQPANPRKVA